MLNWCVFANVQYADAQTLDGNCSAKNYRGSGDLGEALPVLGFFQQFSSDRAKDANFATPEKPKRCLLSARDLKRLKQPVLVDVRRKSDYEKGALTGSINIPEHQVSSRGFLKNRVLVLVDYSYHYADMFSYCDSLQHDGFRSVYILDGGYVQQENAKLNTLSPRQFFNAKRKHLWLVVAATKEKPLTNEQVVWVDNTGNNSAVRSSIKRALAKIANSATLRANILLLDDSGSQEKTMTSLIEKNLLSQTYYLSGGYEAYQQFAKTNTAMLNQQRRHSASTGVPCGG